MTLKEAFLEFSNSPEFRDVARQKNSMGGKFRLYLVRFKKDELKYGAMSEILIANGYEIGVNKLHKK